MDTSFHSLFINDLLMLIVFMYSSNVITKTDSKERIPRLSIKTPALICEKSIDVDIDDSLFPLEVTHGKIKIIPPKARMSS